MLRTIITLFVLIAPVFTTAKTMDQSPQSKRIEWNNSTIYSLLKQRDPRQGYMPKIQGILDGAFDSGIRDVSEIRLSANLRFPWVTLMGLFDPNIDADDDVDGVLNVIIGDFNRFPIYVQGGRLDSLMMIGRRTSELLMMDNLSTQACLHGIIGSDRFGWGGGLGYYTANDYGNIHIGGFVHDKGKGASIQYDAVYQGIHWLFGGGGAIIKLPQSEVTKNINNLYVEISGREGVLNNWVKAQYEIIWGQQHATKTQIKSYHFNAWHAELSYHLPLYYFENASSVVAGYSALNNAAYHGWFGGLKVNCLRYFDVMAGGQYGRYGLSPLLQLQFVAII